MAYLHIVKPKGIVVWLTGLSGAGKTTIVQNLGQKLQQKEYLYVILDGDEMRKHLNQDLGFTDADRKENVRRTAEIARMFADRGAIVLCSMMSPMREMRTIAQNIIEKERFWEVFVDCPIAVCMQRDVKGLYAKFQRGEIQHLTGMDSPFEKPLTPFMKLDTTMLSVEEASNQLLQKLLTLAHQDDLS